MSSDSKLKNINTIMIMKEENTEDLLPRDQVLIHQQDLEYQQKDLFWAFVNGDRNYIYEFDDETLKRSDHFNQQCFQLGFTAFFCLISSNYMFVKMMRPNTKISNPVKLGLLVTINAIPLSLFSYQGFRMYNKANDYLYERYLRKRNLK
jgi:hypothetical protein